jgi:hypothetical protein
MTTYPLPDRVCWPAFWWPACRGALEQAWDLSAESKLLRTERRDIGAEKRTPA